MFLQKEGDKMFRFESMDNCLKFYLFKKIVHIGNSFALDHLKFY